MLVVLRWYQPLALVVIKGAVALDASLIQKVVFPACFEGFSPDPDP